LILAFLFGSLLTFAELGLTSGSFLLKELERVRGELAAISAKVKMSAPAAPVCTAEIVLCGVGAGVFTCLCCDDVGGGTGRTGSLYYGLTCTPCIRVTY
jgi:hypothetical protein